MHQLLVSAPACRERIWHRLTYGLLTTKAVAMSGAMAVAIAMLLQVFWVSAAHAQSSGHPNMIFILADDQGFGDVGALNPESKIPTPNIDRIAAEGMIFGDAHTSSSVCTPTRYSILTGRYHWRTRLQKGVLGGFSPPLIDREQLTIAGMLKQQGYRTGAVGKWHLGWNWPLKGGGLADDAGNFTDAYEKGWAVDYEAEIQGGPVDLGFDEFFGISASLDMPPYVYVRDRVPTEKATVEKAFHRKGPAGESFEAVDVLPTFTREAVRFIDSHANGDKPFFLYFPLNAPHTPIVPTKQWRGKSGINDYGDFTMQVDATVGEVLEALDRNKITEETLIIFTTDNGCSPAAKIGQLEAAGHDQNYIYRGHKADIYDGGHRVPFIVRWPGKVKPGSRTEHLVGQLDFFATAAEISGADVPGDAAGDSVSFLKTLLGKAGSPPRRSIVSQSIGGQFAIRDGDWKLCLCPGSGGWSQPRPGRDDMSSLPPMQLYDLGSDPGESRNLIEQHPERVAKMTAMMREAIDRGRTTPGETLDNDVDIVMVKPVRNGKRPLKK
ncbi:arylsulfatase [Roseiconus lacunae]|uniref:Arylsulfatase n=1 Tax=Roseiconus lacunae TaxID=2605694 RepID=A0ABT7PKB8_9BACT|nr:arylsulfatase [Roseiconus lacunae]MDM4016934.1 arylsulfatase [Roseiconus lacunae]WRQ48870.1 arylsulfatase [Stieleria sp. HD01]